MGIEDKFNDDRNEILADLKQYHPTKSLPILIVEYDNLIELVRAGYFVQYHILPDKQQEIKLGYLILDSMMEKYIK